MKKIVNTVSLVWVGLLLILAVCGGLMRVADAVFWMTSGN